MALSLSLLTCSLKDKNRKRNSLLGFFINVNDTASIGATTIRNTIYSRKQFYGITTTLPLSLIAIIILHFFSLHQNIQRQHCHPLVLLHVDTVTARQNALKQKQDSKQQQYNFAHHTNFTTLLQIIHSLRNNYNNRYVLRPATTIRMFRQIGGILRVALN